jgi:hypothetical protein
MKIDATIIGLIKSLQRKFEKRIKEEYEWGSTTDNNIFVMISDDLSSLLRFQAVLAGAQVL